MQQIRLYCKAHDKENPSRYEMTETQILRFKKWNTNEVTFKLYDYCKNDTQSDYDKSMEWLICLIPDNHMTPDSFNVRNEVPKISAEILNYDDISIFKFDYVNIRNDMFVLKIPPMMSGKYTLSVTYNFNDIFTKSFPLIITN